MIYDSDSFFDLSLLERIGLLALSLAMAAALIWLARWMRRTLPRPLWIPLSIALFWAFVWLSPQAYYSYYMLIIPDLPLQSVIKSPPGPDTLAALASFTGERTLSAHSKGVLFWALVAATLLPAKTRTSHA